MLEVPHQYSLYFSVPYIQFLLSVLPASVPTGAPLHQGSLELVELQVHIVHAPLAPTALESQASGSRVTTISFMLLVLK